MGKYMNCFLARKILLLEPHNQVTAGSDYFKAKRHVAECEECQLFFRKEEQLRNILQKKLLRATAPSSLRETILSAIAGERQKKVVPILHKLQQIQNWKTIVGAASAVIVGLMLYFFSDWRQNDTVRTESVLNSLIQDHLAMKLKEHPLDVETSDRTQLERWLAVRVDYNVTVPQFVNANLQGGHLCVIGGKRSVSLSYQNENVPVTLYILDRNIIDLEILKTISSINGKPIFLYGAKGCNTLLWEQRGLVYALVSDLEEEELITLMTQVS